MRTMTGRGFGVGVAFGTVSLVALVVAMAAGSAAQSPTASDEATETTTAAPTDDATTEEPSDSPTEPAGDNGGEALALDTALDAALAARESCLEQGYNVTVAVVDRQGGLIKAHLRGDGSGPHTVESSRRKAYTAASLRRSTVELADRAFSGDPQTAGLADLTDDILLLGGGEPISVDGQVVGGIGVAGAPGGDLDAACAQAGVDAISDGGE